MDKGEKRRAQGSVTVETSLALFLFLMFFICIMYFYTILNMEIKIQSALEQTADTQAAYAAVREYHDEDGSFSYIQCGLNQVFAKANVIRLAGAQYLDSTWIDGGSSGLNFGRSEFLKDGSTLRLVVSYKVKIPFFSMKALTIIQAAQRRVWFGDDTSEKNNQNKIQNNTKNMVFATPNGVAYHLYADCDYIDVKLQAVDISNISSIRNKDGSKYYPCESCHPSADGTMYITLYGNRYHSSANCKAIEKEPEQISIQEIGKKHLCNKCAERASG